VDRESLQLYVDVCKTRVGLAHWKIDVDKGTADDDCWADIEVSENLWEATLRVSADFFEQTQVEQRRVIAHELIHVHYAGVERAVDTLNGVLGQEGFAIFEKLFDVETERGADSLSRVVAITLPFPEEVLRNT